jgi:hypothetical protein
MRKGTAVSLTAQVQAGVRGLVRPTVADLRESVERVSRGDERLWPLLCIAAQVAPDDDDPATLARLLDVALERHGPVRLAALAISVRLRTYHALTALRAAGSDR